MSRVSKVLLIIAACLFAFGLTMTVSGCRVCKPGEMRCSGEKVQLCDKAGRWQIVMDCTKTKSLKDAQFCCKCTEDKKKCYCSTKCVCEKPINKVLHEALRYKK